MTARDALAGGLAFGCWGLTGYLIDAWATLCAGTHPCAAPWQAQAILLGGIVGLLLLAPLILIVAWGAHHA